MGNMQIMVFPLFFSFFGNQMNTLESTDAK